MKITAFTYFCLIISTILYCIGLFADIAWVVLIGNVPVVLALIVNIHHRIKRK